MSTLERLSSFLGIVLIGFAAYVVASDRERLQQRSRSAAPPVEELGDKLRQAWAGHHNA